MSNPRTSKKTRLKGAERAFREASLFLGESGGFSLASAVFGHPVRREYWIRRLTETLAEANVQLSHCQLPDSDDTRLVNVIAQHLNSVPTQPGFKRAVVVTGMSHQLPDAATSHRPGETAPRFLAEANLDRELFPQRCPHPLLLCVTPTALGQFTRFAPDLWHWCGHTFDFTEPALPDNSYPIRGIMELQETDPGTVYANRDELLRAAGVFRTGLDAAIAAYGARHQETVSVRAKLVNVLWQLGRTNAAYLLAQENIKLIETLSDYPEVEVANVFSQFAVMLEATNRHVEAEQLMRRSLAIWEEQLGSENPQVASGLSNLANLLKASNRLVEAEALARRAVTIWELNFGKNHEKIAIGLSNLASLLYSLGRFIEAEPLMRRALTIWEGCFGSNHTHVATGLNNLANLLRVNNRLSEAELMMRRALSIDEHCFGSNNALVANRLHNLAGILQSTNRVAEAEQVYRRALAIEETCLGVTHPEVAVTLNNLAMLLKDTNRLDEAVSLLQRAVEILLIYSRDNNQNHIHLKTTVNNYGNVLLEMGVPKKQARERVYSMLRENGVSSL